MINDEQLHQTIKILIDKAIKRCREKDDAIVIKIFSNKGIIYVKEIDCAIEQKENDKFKCESCNQYFPHEKPEDWNEKDALNEKNSIFYSMLLEDMKIVCDDCFKKIMGWAIQEGYYDKSVLELISKKNEK